MNKQISEREVRILIFGNLKEFIEKHPNYLSGKIS